VIFSAPLMECPGPPVNRWTAAGDRGVLHVGEAVSGVFETMDRL
jgi:hypothetical protein